MSARLLNESGAGRIADGVFAGKLPKAHTFRAWRVVDDNGPRFEAHPVGELTSDSLKGACDEAIRAMVFYHRETLLVLERNEAERIERRSILHTYRIRKRGRPNFVRGPDGRAVREARLYPEHQFSVAVPKGFSPAEPWKAEDGNPSGIDRTLVEGSEG